MKMSTKNQTGDPIEILPTKQLFSSELNRAKNSISKEETRS